MYYVVMVDFNEVETREQFETLNEAMAYLKRNQRNAMYGYVATENDLANAEETKNEYARLIEEERRERQEMLDALLNDDEPIYRPNLLW